MLSLIHLQSSLMPRGTEAQKWSKKINTFYIKSMVHLRLLIISAAGSGKKYSNLSPDFLNIAD